MLNKMLNTCRICGYTAENFIPWGEDGQIPSYEICPCCNVEFGYEDTQISSIRNYRKKWIKSEKFKSDVKFPKQLENISHNFF